MPKLEPVVQYDGDKMTIIIKSDIQDKDRFDPIMKCENCGLRGTRECLCKFKASTGLEILEMLHPGFLKEAGLIKE